MDVSWADDALEDLDRLYRFLAGINPDAAARTVQMLVDAPLHLIIQPRAGIFLSRYEPREVRRLIVGSYEMHYELQFSTLLVLRVWHTRENRPLFE